MPRSRRATCAGPRKSNQSAHRSAPSFGLGQDPALWLGRARGVPMPRRLDSQEGALQQLASPCIQQASIYPQTRRIWPWLPQVGVGLLPPRQSANTLGSNKCTRVLEGLGRLVPQEELYRGSWRPRTFLATLRALILGLPDQTVGLFLP